MTEPAPTPAEVQFNKSSVYPVPQGYEAWQIRNDYPPPPPPWPEITGGDHIPRIPGQIPGDYPDAPWLHVDFRTQPRRFMEIIKEYCFEGNVENDFVVQNNKVRNWYHAPWMHYSPNGREPLHGLTFERPTPPKEFAKTQTSYLQTWACGYYNSPGASLFGGVWKDPNAPKWDKDVLFPRGSLVFKLLLTDASDKEIPILKGSPTWQAVIAQQPDPTVAADPSKRNTEPSPLRLLQMDFAISHHRAPTGWIFGTFMYDGTKFHTEHHHHEHHARKWDRIIPVGLMWGNDPELTQEAFEAGKKSVESWINPEADEIRIKLAGGRPSWGWNGRLNGPADNFISACASCHSTAQRPPPTGMTPNPPPKKNSEGQWIPQDPNTMDWFRNIPAGKPFEEGGISGDYSLQLMIGFENYEQWRKQEVDKDAPLSWAHRTPLRAGPEIVYD